MSDCRLQTAIYSVKSGKSMNVVITGASRGLGKAFARTFAAGGYNLLLCARTRADLDISVAALREEFPGISVEASPFDLSTGGGAKDFGAWVLDKGTSVDVLINNAGSFIPGSIYGEAEGVLETMMDTNLYSAYHLTRTLLPSMVNNKRGHIFNICSIASLEAYPNGGAYSISKFALLGFSRNLREELKPQGIKVTAICPGAAYTASWEGSGIDPRRIMRAEDVARMVFAAASLSEQATVEDIVMRPQLGDL
jgi:short-subunit dehydrogenase